MRPSLHPTFLVSRLPCIPPSLLPGLLRVSKVLSQPSVFEAAWGELWSKVLNMRLLCAKPPCEALEWPLGHCQSHGNPQNHRFPYGEVLGAMLWLGLVFKHGQATLPWASPPRPFLGREGQFGFIFPGTWCFHSFHSIPTLA